MSFFVSVLNESYLTSLILVTYYLVYLSTFSTPKESFLSLFDILKVSFSVTSLWSPALGLLIFSSILTSSFLVGDELVD